MKHLTFYLALLILLALPFMVRLKAADLPDTLYIAVIEEIVWDTMSLAPNERPADWIRCDTIWRLQGIPTRQIIENWMKWWYRENRIPIKWYGNTLGFDWKELENQIDYYLRGGQ